MTALWLALLLKMATTAGVVVLACLMVERAGPLVGAMIATLPVSAGPAYAFLALEHGPAFIAASALTSLSALAATSVFVTVYAYLARHHALLPSIAAAILAWLAMAALVRALAPGLALGVCLNLALFAACAWTVRDWRRAPLATRGPATRWDIPVRAAAAMLLVALVLTIGRVLGPRAAGVAALAPVVMTSLGILLYPRLGGAGAAAVLANTLPGMLGNTAAVAVLHLTAIPLGSGLALLLALAICIAWNGSLVAWQRWR